MDVSEDRTRKRNKVIRSEVRNLLARSFKVATKKQLKKKNWYSLHVRRPKWQLNTAVKD
jgi:hypothetical protein